MPNYQNGFSFAPDGAEYSVLASCTATVVAGGGNVNVTISTSAVPVLLVGILPLATTTQTLLINNFAGTLFTTLPAGVLIIGQYQSWANTFFSAGLGMTSTTLNPVAGCIVFWRLA